jgi:hypothetical protein
MTDISDIFHCLRLKIYNIWESGSISIFRQNWEWKYILEGLETKSSFRAHHSRLSPSPFLRTDTNNSPKVTGLFM